MTDDALVASSDEGADPIADGAEAPIVRPYGLVGLTISVPVILIVTTILCALCGALAFGVAGLVLGWQPALVRFAALRTAAGTDATFVQRLGIVISLVIYAALSASVLGAARLRGGAHWRDLVAWRPWHPVRGARFFWILAVVAIIYSLAADELISHLYPPSTEWVTLPSGKLWSGLFIALAVLFAPIAEELLFRGWLYTSLRPRIGVWAGILVSSVLFALAHWEKAHLYALAVFPIGVALGLIRERTGSLKASMTFHAVYNATASILLVLGSS